MALLDVKNLTKRFGGLVANKDISLSVEAGEIVAIIGPNGAGKSTLFNGLVGHHEPTSGTVAFAGESMIGRRPEQVAAMEKVRADTVEVEGVTGSQIARSSISQVLSDKLGQGKSFKVAVRYDEAFDPFAALPSPEECAADLNAVMAKRKITFPPNSAEITPEDGATMDALAEILKGCPASELR